MPRAAGGGTGRPWWWWTKRGEIILLNLQTEKQFGSRHDELLGQKVTSNHPRRLRRTADRGRLRYAKDTLAQQIGTGIELIRRRTDRSAFPIKILLSRLESVYGILVTVAIRNISVRKKETTRIERLKRRLRRDCVPRIAHTANLDREVSRPPFRQRCRQGPNAVSPASRHEYALSGGVSKDRHAEPSRSAA